MTWCQDDTRCRLDAVLDLSDVYRGVLTMELVLQGASCMHMIDDAFQRALEDERQNRKIKSMLD